jgi:hypothetical protein
MSAALLDELAQLDIRVERDGDRLLVDGPENVLTDDLLAAISAAKPDLLALLGPAAEAPSQATTDAAPAVNAPSRETVGRGVVDGADPRGNGRAEAIRSPWRCFACGSGERRHRAAWGDWVCAFCRAIVAGPDQTERPWRIRGRVGPFPCSGPPTVTWGSERGYLAVRDPHTGDWHQIPYREATPVWPAAIRVGRRP